MDEYYDSEYEDSWEKKKPKSKSKKRNPKGAYNINLYYRGTHYDIIIENINHDDFKIRAKTINENENTDIDPFDNIKSLERYLRLEGFYDAARQWNMYFK